MAEQEEILVIDPLSGDELTQEDIDTEVQSRIDAIEFATKEEIIAALKDSHEGGRPYLKAFSEKELPRLTKAEIKDIAEANPKTAPSAQITNLNKSELFRTRRLNIISETPKNSAAVVSRVLCNTRIQISGQPVHPSTLALHQAVREKIPPQYSKKAELLELIVDQYLGIPLVNLSAYLDVEEADISSAIESINEELKSSKVKIQIRNGVAIIGDIHGYVNIFDNAETRKNLFPPKKEAIQTKTSNAKATRLEAELSAALGELSGEREKTAAAETRAANAESKVKELTRQLSEAEEIALKADQKAGQAESKVTSLEENKKTLETQVAQLELDIQESLRISAETAQGSGLEDLKRGKEKAEAEIKRLEAKLEAKTIELTTSREESRTAREEARVAKSFESNLKKQLDAAKKQAAEAEEARGAAMRKAGRGGVDVDSARDKATIQNLEETIRRGEEQLRSLRQQLQRQNGLATIHPEELARLKRASTELASTTSTVTDLQRQVREKDRRIQDLESRKSPAQPEQKDSPELAQLRAELAAKDAALIKAQQDLAQSAQQVTSLTEELGIANELLESATSSTPAAVQTPTLTQAPTPKTPTAAAPTQAPKLKPAPVEDSIKKIEKTDFRNSEELINAATKALTLNAGTTQHGLPKSKLRELRNALTNLQFGKDSWLHDTRVKIVKALKDLQEKGNGDHIPVEAVEAFIRTIDGLPK